MPYNLKVLILPSDMTWIVCDFLTSSIEANYKRKICADIIGEIEAGNNTKRRIITVLPYSTNEINDEFRELKNLNRILYNKQLHVWEIVPITDS